MLLSSFQHHRPRCIDEALETFARYEDDCAFYAGGTELLLSMKARVLRYGHLIDLKGVAGLRDIECHSGEVVVGALVTHFRMATDDLVKDTIPAYAALSDNIGNIRVRVMGTLVGNICFAEPHADPPTMLSALGARLMLVGPDGEREVLVSDFVEGPFSTSRADGEIVTAVRIPVTAPDETFSYQSFGHLEYPAVSVASGCIRKEGMHSYRVWVGAIGDRPIHLDGLERDLEGVPGHELPDVLQGATERAASGLPASDDIYGSADYKRHLASVFMRRTLLRCAADREAKS